MHLLHQVLNKLTDMESKMATNAELQAAVDDLVSAIDTGFVSIAQTISDETQEVIDAIAAAGVDQAVIDQLVALKATLVQKVADIQADISDTV